MENLHKDHSAMHEQQQSFKLTRATIALLNKSDFPSTLTIDQCSSALAMSQSSFRRKLTQEQTSFKHIQSKFLNELCVQALLTNQIRIDDLAIKLGYAERSTFERTFQNKFGLRPSQFRNLAGAINPPVSGLLSPQLIL